MIGIGDDREQSICGSDYTYEATAIVDPADPMIKAWLTLKNYPEGLAAADPGALQKVVTTTDVPGVGQVSAPGYDGNGLVRFDLTATQTRALGQRDFAFDVKVQTAAGKEFYVARGLWSNTGSYTLSS